MKLLPSSPISRFVEGVTLDGKPINAFYVDLATGQAQYFENDNQRNKLEARGKIEIVLRSKAEDISLDLAMSTELDKLLEDAKQRMAKMSPEDRQRMFEQQRASMARGLIED